MSNNSKYLYTWSERIAISEFIVNTVIGIDSVQTSEKSFCLE